MDGEIQVITDENGLAVLGKKTAVEAFLTSHGLLATSKTLGSRLRPLTRLAADVTQVGAEVAAESGRWVKLTPESAKAVAKYGLRTSSKTGNATGVVLNETGKRIGGFVEFSKTPGALLNPTMLSGVAGVMSQIAMQQSIGEITAYLDAIDVKVDKVLRKQDDSVRAQLDGVTAGLERVSALQAEKGRVTETDWAIAHGTTATLGSVTGYAVRQLEAVADELEGQGKVRDLSRTTRRAQGEVREWLAVLAHCFQLQETHDVLDLDRVLSSAPEEAEAHGRALESVRQARLSGIETVTGELLSRMDAAVGVANDGVLLHPVKSPRAVAASNRVAGEVGEFHDLLAIGADPQTWDPRRWRTAAGDLGQKAAPAVAGVTAVGAIAVKFAGGRFKKN